MKVLSNYEIEIEIEKVMSIAIVIEQFLRFYIMIIPSILISIPYFYALCMIPYFN